MRAACSCCRSWRALADACCVLLLSLVACSCLALSAALASEPRAPFARGEGTRASAHTRAGDFYTWSPHRGYLWGRGPHRRYQAVEVTQEGIPLRPPKVGEPSRRLELRPSSHKAARWPSCAGTEPSRRLADRCTSDTSSEYREGNSRLVASDWPGQAKASQQALKPASTKHRPSAGSRCHLEHRL